MEERNCCQKKEFCLKNELVSDFLEYFRLKNKKEREHMFSFKYLFAKSSWELKYKEIPQIPLRNVQHLLFFWNSSFISFWVPSAGEQMLDPKRARPKPATAHKKMQM